MAINLNSVNSTLSSHASRITALEGKVGSGGVGFVNIPFKKPFNTVITCSAAMIRNCGAGDYRSIGALSTTSVNVCKDGSSRSLFIDIGYLITNRLLNYIREKLNSFKNLKGVMNGKTWRSFYNLMADSNVGDKGDSNVSKFAVNNGGVLEWL